MILMLEQLDSLDIFDGDYFKTYSEGNKNVMKEIDIKSVTQESSTHVEKYLLLPLYALFSTLYFKKVLYCLYCTKN